MRGSYLCGIAGGKLDLKRSLNFYWKEIYDAVVKEAKTMLIFVTEAWMKSKWTWGELKTGLERSKSDLTFLLFGSQSIEAEFAEHMKKTHIATDWKTLAMTKTGMQYSLDSMSKLTPKSLLQLVQRL